MKALAAVITAIIALLLFTSCSVLKTDLPMEQGSDTPPDYTVSYDGKEYTALPGTYDWTYTNANGTKTTVTADSAHPLDCLDLMPCLLVKSGGSVDELICGEEPQFVTLRHWDIAFAGDSTQYENYGELPPEDAKGYICEIEAVFGEGSASYCYAAMYYDPLEDGDISLILTNANAVGASVEYTNNAFTEADFGAQYYVERLEGNVWEEVPYVNEPEWTQELYIFGKGESREVDMNWEQTYGALPAGNYRIVKIFSVSSEPDASVIMRVEAYFSLEASAFGAESSASGLGT